MRKIYVVMLMSDETSNAGRLLGVTEAGLDEAKALATKSPAVSWREDNIGDWPALEGIVDAIWIGRVGGQYDDGTFRIEVWNLGDE